jgi:hypothetical protein
MAFRRIALIYGWLATACGVLLMMWGPMFLRYLGDLVNNDFGSYSLIRLAGVGFLFAGVLMLALRPITDLAIQRRISVAMVAAHTFAGLIVWAQQQAIWDSHLGAVLTICIWLAGASFGLFLFWTRKGASVVTA